MSVAEIIEQLPKLTAEERRTVRQRLQELEGGDELQFLRESADSMFQDMDREEAKNARRKAR